MHRILILYTHVLGAYIFCSKSGKSSLNESPCDGDITKVAPPDSWGTKDAVHVKLYREVIRVYCAMEDGSVYSQDFSWDETIEDHDPW